MTITGALESATLPNDGMFSEKENPEATPAPQKPQARQYGENNKDLPEMSASWSWFSWFGPGTGLRW